MKKYFLIFCCIIFSTHCMDFPVGPSKPLDFSIYPSRLEELPTSVKPSKDDIQSKKQVVKVDWLPSYRGLEERLKGYGQLSPNEREKEYWSEINKKKLDLEFVRELSTKIPRELQPFIRDKIFDHYCNELETYLYIDDDGQINDDVCSDSVTLSSTNATDVFDLKRGNRVIARLKNPHQNAPFIHFGPDPSDLSVPVICGPNEHNIFVIEKMYEKLELIIPDASGSMSHQYKINHTGGEITLHPQKPFFLVHTGLGLWLFRSKSEMAHSDRSDDIEEIKFHGSNASHTLSDPHTKIPSIKYIMHAAFGPDNNLFFLYKNRFAEYDYEKHYLKIHDVETMLAHYFATKAPQFMSHVFKNASVIPTGEPIYSKVQQFGDQKYQIQLTKFQVSAYAPSSVLFEFTMYIKKESGKLLKDNTTYYALYDLSSNKIFCLDTKNSSKKLFKLAGQKSCSKKFLRTNIPFQSHSTRAALLYLKKTLVNSWMAEIALLGVISDWISRGKPEDEHRALCKLFFDRKIVHNRAHVWLRCKELVQHLNLAEHFGEEKKSLNNDSSMLKDR